MNLHYCILIGVDWVIECAIVGEIMFYFDSYKETEI